MGRFDLSNDEWAVIWPLLPKGTRGSKRSPADDRRILNAIFYILRTGAPWANLPERYGPYKTAYNRYNRWAMRSIVERFFSRMKDMRRLATRFEKRARNFQAMVHLFCIKMYLN